MHPHLRALAGLAAASTALGFATAATAAPDAGSGPQPVPASDFRPVSVDVAITDAAGQVVATRACDWTVPEDDDRPCLAFKSDAQYAFAAIEDAGGTGATVHTVSAPIGLDATSRYTRRADGTWLIRTRGRSDGKAFHNGMVCTADGQRCVRFDTAGRKSGTRSAKAAAAKLRRGR